MGAWGYGSFENDDAMDWVTSLRKSEGLSVLERAFRVIIDAGDEYLEIQDCSNAVAAGEVVAYLLGRPSDKVPATVAVWAEGKPKINQSLIEHAKAAIKIVMNSSELQEVWADSGSPEWVDACEDLLQRLVSPRI